MSTSVLTSDARMPPIHLTASPGFASGAFQSPGSSFPSLDVFSHIPCFARGSHLVPNPTSPHFSVSSLYLGSSYHVCSHLLFSPCPVFPCSHAWLFVMVQSAISAVVRMMCVLSVRVCVNEGRTQDPGRRDEVIGCGCSGPSHVRVWP